MTTFEPTQAFRHVLTELDTGSVDVIIVPTAHVAAWAEANGYRIERFDDGEGPVYEIRPGDEADLL